MPVNPFSRYRNLPVLEVKYATGKITQSLPIRRNVSPGIDQGARYHRFASYEAADQLAWKYFGQESLFWWLLDANEGRLPETWETGETLQIPPLSLATRIERPG